ncbi:MAG: prenyltransferase [Polyangiales bacterium]
MKVFLRSPELFSSRTERWLYALKPASWPKLLVPTLLGQALGAFSSGAFEVAPAVWGSAFTLTGLGFIVLINDWGDRDVDAIKRAMFPDTCSPKTIPDRILSESAVGLAGLSLALATLLIGAGSEVALRRPWGFEASAICVAVFAAYTLPPFRLNYRGGGELLEMIGVGVALPLYNAYLQAGFLAPGLWPWIGGFALLSLGSGVASGLSDEESDRRGGKRTIASVFGNRAARVVTEASLLTGAGLWLLGAVLEPDGVPPSAVLPAIAIVAWRFTSLRKMSATAVTNAFPAQARYKHLLHSAIWHSTVVAAVVLWLHLAVS